MLTVECLAKNILDKILDNPTFLDVAMRKIGTRMQQEHVPRPKLSRIEFMICFQITMMKAVEVRGGKDSDDNIEDVEQIARAHGFPLSLPKLVEEKFDDCAHVFMKENFKSAIPVSHRNRHKTFNLHKRQEYSHRLWYDCSDAGFSRLNTNHRLTFCGLLSTVLNVDANWVKVFKEKIYQSNCCQIRLAKVNATKITFYKL